MASFEEFQPRFEKLVHTTDPDQQIEGGKALLVLIKEATDWPLEIDRNPLVGMVYMMIGVGFGNRETGEPDENIERGIEAYEIALTALTSDDVSELRATIQSNLGKSYQMRTSGGVTTNRERARECFEAALSQFTPQQNPLEYADTQERLGTLYLTRTLGEKESNIERGIAALEAALTIYKHHQGDNRRRRILYNLGYAYFFRPTGDRGDNIAKTIAALTESLSASELTEDGVDRADTYHLLGAAYHDARHGSRPDNLKNAAAAYRAALANLDQDVDPAKYATMQKLLLEAQTETPPSDAEETGSVDDPHDPSPADESVEQEFTPDLVDLLKRLSKEADNTATFISNIFKHPKLLAALSSIQVGPLPQAIAQPLALLRRVQGTENADRSALNEAILGLQNALPTVTVRRHWLGIRRELGAALLMRAELNHSKEDATAAAGLAGEILSALLDLHQLQWTLLQSANDFPSRVKVAVDYADLDAAIAFAESAFKSLSNEELDDIHLLNILGAFRFQRFLVTRMIEDISAAIDHSKAVIRFYNEQGTTDATCFANISLFLIQRFAITHSQEDLDAASSYCEAALRAPPGDDFVRAELFGNHSDARLLRFELLQAENDLEAAIESGRRSIDLLPALHPRRRSRLGNLSNCLAARYQLKGRREDLDDSIRLVEEVAQPGAAASSADPTLMMITSNRLKLRYDTDTRTEDLDRAIDLAESAIRQSSDNSSFHCHLAALFLVRFERENLGIDLEGGLRHADFAIQLNHREDREKLRAQLLLMNFLAHRLSMAPKNELLRDIERGLDCATSTLRLAREMNSPTATIYGQLSQFHRAKFDNFGAPDDLDSSVHYARTAVMEAEDTDLNRTAYQRIFAHALFRRFQLLGANDDLDTAIDHLENSIRRDSTDKSAMSIVHLCHCLQAKFDLTGTRSVLDLAIERAESILRSGDTDSFAQIQAHDIVANLLWRKFSLTGSPDDLDGAIENAERASRLPLNKDEIVRDRGRLSVQVITTLSNLLFARFERFGSRPDLDRTVSLAQHVVDITSSEMPEYPTFLCNLAIRLARRANGADLDTAIGHAERAIQLAPKGAEFASTAHMNLASLYGQRFNLTKDQAHIDTAIALDNAALAITPAGFHRRPAFQWQQTRHLIAKYKLTRASRDLDAAIVSSEEAMFGWQRLAMESEDAAFAGSVVADRGRELITLAVIAGDWQKLVNALEATKAIRLRAELAGSGKTPGHLDSAGRGRYLQVRDELKALRAELRILDGLPAHQRSTTISGNISNLRGRETVLRDERQRLEAGDPIFNGSPLDYAAVLTLAKSIDGALVYLQPLHGEDNALLVQMVHPGSPEAAPRSEDTFHIPNLGLKSMDEILSAQMSDAYQAQKTFTPADGVPLGWLTANWADKRGIEGAHLRWLDTISLVVDRIGRELMTPVARHLNGLDVKRVVLIPGEGLGLIPLHACPINKTATVFGELFETSYAPSATTLCYTPRRASPSRISPTLVGVANPDGTLAFADIEMRRVARLFGENAKIQHGRAARRAWLIAETEKADIVALSTHATFSMGRPEQSFFVLAHADGREFEPWSIRDQRDVLREQCDRLSLNDILRGELRLAPGALVVADACETGQIAPGDTADEFVGFPAAFMASGAGAVIASLWSVSDFSTALLMEQVYKHIILGEPPARALQQAMSWLRRLSRAELRIDLETEMATIIILVSELTATLAKSAEQEPELISRIKTATFMADTLSAAIADLDNGPEHPFDHPFYWAPFAVYGHVFAPPQGT